MEKFRIKYTGQLREAKLILVGRNVKTEYEIENMTEDEIIEAMNKYFVFYDFGEDWLAIPKDKEKEFNEITDWVCR